MEERELFNQNPWWKDPALIDADYDILRWKEKTYHWEPQLIDRIGLEPFSLHIITGPRQAGKTTAVKLLIRSLLGTWKPASLFYFNCENLAGYQELAEVLDAYLAFREGAGIDRSVIVLDEITLPKEWYRALKYTIDRGKLRNDVVILTGSSSMTVKREIELFPGRRGKGKDFVLYPLSFRGFVGAVDPDLARKLPIITRLEDVGKAAPHALLFEKELQQHLAVYLEYGGFPLSVAALRRSKDDAKNACLSWIKNTVLKAERSDLLARQVVKVLVETAQSAISWEGIAKQLDIKSPKTAAAYIDLLRSMFAVNVLYTIDPSGKTIRFGRNKKVHVRDPLLLDIFADWALTRPSNREAALAEAVVVEHLLRLFPDRVFFWKNGFEIDAVVLDGRRLHGVEVKWSAKTDAPRLSHLTTFLVLTKTEYHKPTKIPLAVFLSLFDV